MHKHTHSRTHTCWPPEVVWSGDPLMEEPFDQHHGLVAVPTPLGHLVQVHVDTQQLPRPLHCLVLQVQHIGLHLPLVYLRQRLVAWVLDLAGTTFHLAELSRLRRGAVDRSVVQKFHQGSVPLLHIVSAFRIEESVAETLVPIRVSALGGQDVDEDSGPILRCVARLNFTKVLLGDDAVPGESTNDVLDSQFLNQGNAVHLESHQVLSVHP